MKRVGQRLESETLADVFALNEFRHCRDNTRMTAWTVSEVATARLARKKPATVHAFLSAERLRRVNELIRDLCEDIDLRLITIQTDRLESVSASVKLLHHKLVGLLAEQRQTKSKLTVQVS